MRKLPEIKHLPEDVELWYEETQDVEAFIQPQEKPMHPLIVKEIQPTPQYEGLYNANSFNEIILGNTDNIDKNTASKFVKGNYKIEARLDLHGYTEKGAFSAVLEFIKDSYIQKKRCILIITGKGLKDDKRPWYETKGIINQALMGWLNNPEIRPFILSVSQAKQSDGGGGAFYVLLKRQRNLNKTEIF